MVNKQEDTFLFKEKAYTEGKGEIQARKEIVAFENSQKQFKALWLENERNKKEIAKMEKTIKELKEENFKLSFKKLGRKEVPERECSGSFNHCNRILHNMEVGKHYMVKELCNELCMTGQDLNDVLYFLEKNNFIKIERPIHGGLIRIQ